MHSTQKEQLSLHSSPSQWHNLTRPKQIRWLDCLSFVIQSSSHEHVKIFLAPLRRDLRAQQKTTTSGYQPFSECCPVQPRLAENPLRSVGETSGVAPWSKLGVDWWAVPCSGDWERGLLDFFEKLIAVFARHASPVRPESDPPASCQCYAPQGWSHDGQSSGDQKVPELWEESCVQPSPPPELAEAEWVALVPSQPREVTQPCPDAPAEELHVGEQRARPLHSARGLSVWVVAPCAGQGSAISVLSLLRSWSTCCSLSFAWASASVAATIPSLACWSWAAANCVAVCVCL